jgi:hypothetical protein
LSARAPVAVAPTFRLSDFPFDSAPTITCAERRHGSVPRYKSSRAQDLDYFYFHRVPATNSSLCSRLSPFFAAL